MMRSHQMDASNDSKAVDVRTQQSHLYFRVLFSCAEYILNYMKHRQYKEILMMHRHHGIFKLIILLIAILQVAGCGGGGGGSGSTADSPDPVVDPPDLVVDPPNPVVDPPILPAGGLKTVDDETWDETAVRKVLRTFAFGGQADDEQIRSWADMSPGKAIREILTFDPHNLDLSPENPVDTDRLSQRDGTWEGLSEFWSSSDPENPVYPPYKPRYAPGALIDYVWIKAAISRGLNPFRQKVGLWETNYHMAVNMEFTPKRQVTRYYDDVMNALEAGMAYQDVMSVAAASAAIATQYGHRNNVFINGVCLCNEDFAREYFQLFFGITADNESAYHETVTIKNMASALTGMYIAQDLVHGGLGADVVYGTEKHYPGVLEMLHSDVGGQNAWERINAISQVAIAHEDSLNNLPVMIVEGLADDNLDAKTRELLQNTWKAMPENNLLEFIRAYAISESFHSQKRVKFHDSIDRHIFITNQFLLSNEEGYLNLYNANGFEFEDVEVFKPKHNVFGGQTGIEAAESAEVFRQQYNRSTGNFLAMYTASGEKYGQVWTKDWGALMSAGSGSGYKVKDAAEWLWNRFIVDGLKNFGLLERAHVYALLATGYDLSYLSDPARPDRIIKKSDIESDQDLKDLVLQLQESEIHLDSQNDSERIAANQRVGQAINFITATPYIFAQEGR